MRQGCMFASLNSVFEIGHTCISMYVCIYTHNIYIYIERERSVYIYIYMYPYRGGTTSVGRAGPADELQEQGSAQRRPYFMLHYTIV